MNSDLWSKAQPNRPCLMDPIPRNHWIWSDPAPFFLRNFHSPKELFKKCHQLLRLGGLLVLEAVSEKVIAIETIWNDCYHYIHEVLLVMRILFVFMEIQHYSMVDMCLLCFFKLLFLKVFWAPKHATLGSETERWIHDPWLCEAQPWHKYFEKRKKHQPPSTKSLDPQGFC